jgi:hypothetical protein
MIHELADHPDHPDDAHQMIHVFMSHKNMAHFHPIISGMLQLMKDRTATSAIHQEILPVIFNQSVLSPPFLQPLRIRHKTNICSLQTPKYHVLLCL